MFALCLPVLYVLSVGPICRVQRETNLLHNARARQAVEKLYDPLTDCMVHSHSLGGRSLRIYVRLWSSDGFPEEPQ
jgi:hypothetical protein